MNHLDMDPHLFKFTLEQTRNERDKMIEDLKKSNAKITRSIEIINMLTSRIDMKTNFTQNECEDVQNYIYLKINNF